MKKKTLFVCFLTVVFILCFSVAFAKGQEQKQVKAQVQKTATTTATTTPTNGELHRSDVANFVQNLLKVADREKGIGEQVRVIAQKQGELKQDILDNVEKIQKRDRVKTFFIGTDYKNLGQLKSKISELKNQIDQLKNVLDKTTIEEDKKLIQEQIQKLETEQTAVNNFIKANENKFSLFGWLVKLFNK